jgi:hypothetical protein
MNNYVKHVQASHWREAPTESAKWRRSHENLPNNILRLRLEDLLVRYSVICSGISCSKSS